MTDLANIHTAELEMLAWLSKFCCQNNIKYYLTDGTLLGAVRHKGFIPWDDDVDIAMSRPEYERFVSMVSDKVDTPYSLQTWCNDSQYAFPYAKLINTNFRISERVASTKRVNEGVFIDIFPVDSCAQNMSNKLSFYYYIFLNKLLLLKCGYQPWRSTGAKHKKIVYVPFVVVSRFVRRKGLIQQIKSITKRWNSQYKGSEYGFENVGYSFTKWIFKKELVERSELIPFENLNLASPVGRISYLNTIYGDFMKLPPISERIPQHAE